MPNYSNKGGAFPTLDLASNSSPAAIPQIAGANPQALEEIGQAADRFGQNLQDLAVRATKKAAGDQAIGDATAAGPTGALTRQDDATVFGQTYNEVAKQTLGSQRRVALTDAMNNAYIANQDDPGALNQALGDIQKGFGTSGFPDLDASLSDTYAAQHGDLMVRAASALRDRTIKQGQANFAETLDQGVSLLAQTAQGASFDAVGSQRVATTYAGLIQNLSRYGPKEAFDIGPQHFDADPTRLGALDADAITNVALAANKQGTTSWILGQNDRLPTFAAKAQFVADLKQKYADHDPLMAGIDGTTADQLFGKLETDARQAGTDERAQKELARQDTRGMIEALRIGAPVDVDAMMRRAQDSGDPGTVADANFWANVNREQPGVLKHVAAVALGLIPPPGGPPDQLLDAAGNGAPPGEASFALPPGKSAVADQIMAAAKANGATPAEAERLVRIAGIESSYDPNRDNGKSQGLFQFRPPTWAAAGGGDIRSVGDQTRNALTLMRHNAGSLQAALGRPASAGELYLAHQQGAPGATALLTAPPGSSAVDALTPVYNSPDVAARAVVGNGGSPSMSANAFAHMWTARLDAIDPWAPPPGTQPGSATYVAFANTKEQATADPIEFARGSQYGPHAAIAPMNINAVFSNDANQLPAWGQALRQRQAAGAALARTYMVPQRMLTNGERDTLRAQIASDPAAGVALARGAIHALGPAGATDLIKEVGAGAGAEVSTAMALAGLQISGQTNIVDRAIEGLRLKANGAKPAGFDTAAYGAGALDREVQKVASALRFAPQLSVAARNIGELAHIADANKGIQFRPSDYIQAALGGGQSNGRWYGGVAPVNGAPALIPPWLAQDRVTDALHALGDSWAQHPGFGPVYANGQAMKGSDVSRLVPVVNPAGTYWLLDPKSGKRATSAGGGLIEEDFDHDRAYIAARVPDGVLR